MVLETRVPNLSEVIAELLEQPSVDMWPFRPDFQRKRLFPGRGTSLVDKLTGFCGGSWEEV